MRLDAERLFELEPGLWQSSRPGLYPPPDIQVVINVSDTPNDFVIGHGLLAVLHLPLADHAFPGFDWLHLAVDSVSMFRKIGSVLIHCDMGESRSSMILLAYLIRERRMTLESAMEWLRHRNPYADPNHQFLDGLADFERRVGVSTGA